MMKISEAIATLQIGKKKAVHSHLYTKWGHTLNPDRVLPEYPRPQMRRASYLNLNGWWEYAIRPKEEKDLLPSSYDGRILVPFSPETLLSGVMRQLTPDGILWYRRSLKMDEIPEGMRLLLHFGAVDQSCTLYVNGRKAGEHSGGYLAFSIDITDHLIEGENVLALQVLDNSDASWKNRGKQKLTPGGMFYTAQSGIWQSVWAEWVPENFIRDLRITPYLDQSSVGIVVRTKRPCKITVTLLGRLRNSKKDEFSVRPFKDVEGQVSVTGSSGSEILLPVSPLYPWSPEHPYLYAFSVTTEHDHVDSYFAMRKFSVGKDPRGIPYLMLNNHPYFQDGVLDQGYWSDGLYTAPSDEALIYDIEEMKKLGFNMIRKHIKVEPMRWYFHCDRLGMIVWQDMLNGGGRSIMTFVLYLPTIIPLIASRFPDNRYRLFSRSSLTGRKIWLRECHDTMAQLYNCPSIGLWTAFNEGWGQFDAVAVWNKMRSWDPTRPIDHASGWYDQGGGDIASHHYYWRELSVRPERRPFCFTEYGGLSRHIDGHSFSSVDFAYTRIEDPLEFRKAFFKLHKDVQELRKEGLAAAVYTQVSDVEEEVNGILTFDRKVNKLEE